MMGREIICFFFRRPVALYAENIVEKSTFEQFFRLLHSQKTSFFHNRNAVAISESMGKVMKHHDDGFALAVKSADEL